MNESAVARPRYALIDAARGVPMLLMIVYHFSWDLTVFGLANFRIFSDPLWIWFAYVIAALILVTMGVTQVMARKRGLTAKAFFRRLGLIVASAGVVSLATHWMDSGSYVFFGILHHIALASVVMAGAVLLPSPALVLLAMLILAAPGFLSHPAFATDWLLWVGLSPVPPASVDYVPLLPWFAFPLLGVVAGRWMFRYGSVPALLKWRPAHPLAKLLRLAGRHSLALYLLHQPILYGGLYLFLVIIGWAARNEFGRPGLGPI